MGPGQKSPQQRNRMLCSPEAPRLAWYRTPEAMPIVHADVPVGLAWNDFTQSPEDPQTQDVALWGRERIKNHHRGGISGGWRVCIEHRWIPHTLRLPIYSSPLTQNLSSHFRLPPQPRSSYTSYCSQPPGKVTSVSTAFRSSAMLIFPGHR